MNNFRIVLCLSKINARKEVTMNYEQDESSHYPATVYSNTECTLEVTSEDKNGWMVWGRRKVVVIKLGNIWVPPAHAHRFAHEFHAQLLPAA